MKLKKYFFSGLAVFLPLILTIYVSIWALNFAESILGKYLKPLFLEHYDFYVWGLGIFILFVLILLCGFLVTNYFGRQIHKLTEQAITNVPVIGSIYPAFKEVAKFLFRDSDNKNYVEQVVLVEWPRKGIWIVGFITNTSPAVVTEKIGRDMVNVLIPSVPNPVSGFVVMVPREDVVPLKMSVEDAIKILVSGGVVNPGQTLPEMFDDTKPAA